MQCVPIIRTADSYS